MAKKGASEDFDYLREESDGSDGVDVVDEENDYESQTEFGYLLGRESQEHDGFDAFDEKTWGEVLIPAPATPWYRSPQARTLLIASGAALSAIVVSVVLLMFRGSPTDEKPTPSSNTTPATTPATTPVTTPVTTPLATATSENPPPPAPPPPPPPPEPSTMERAPAAIRPTVQPRPAKQPEIGVTRTPATRSPISVAPQPRKPRS